MSELTITIDMNGRCKGCGRKGVLDCGYCLRCLEKYMDLKKYVERAVAAKRRRQRLDGRPPDPVAPHPSPLAPRPFPP